MASSHELTVLEQRFLNSIHGHIAGWKNKIDFDFGEASYEQELAKLVSDPVYNKFSFDCPEYVLVRLMGRMSISVGRRLGEIYDKVPRFLASARFNIAPELIAEKFHGLELDIGIRRSLISHEDNLHLSRILRGFGVGAERFDGVGIEIRYNFNPNDSARLRKDVMMAEHLLDEGLFPVYLIFSSISPRDDAIARLTRAGWNFLQGNDASRFTNDLLGEDFLGIMERPAIQQRIHMDVRRMMRSIFESYAFEQVAQSQPAVFND